MKRGGIVIDDEKFMNYIRESKAKGMGEKEIAASIGMTVIELRRNRSQALKRTREEKEDAE